MSTAPVRLRIKVIGMPDLEVDAYPTPVPGLMIHEAPASSPLPGWMIAHAASGYSVGRLADPEAALAAAIDLGALADWTGPVDIGAVIKSGYAAVMQRWGAMPHPQVTKEEARRAGAIL